MATAASNGAGSRLDLLKWAVVGSLVAAGVWGNHHYASEPLLYRALALLVLALLALAVAATTAKGAEFLELAKGARLEARRIVWPTRQECNQTTLVVVGFILLTALILWGLDSLFGWLISLVIG
ncbi:MAG: protein translocase subunit SecE [Porticoccaceae bacterium]|nr:MAG: protein translocase subunit SecE [Porticoccaceae bacterium]